MQEKHRHPLDFNLASSLNTTVPYGIGQLTLVVFLEQLSTELSEVIGGLKSKITAILGDVAFTPYSPSQIHGTILGLEADRLGEVIFNRNGSKFLEKPLSCDLESAIDSILKAQDLPPIRISFGGYKPKVNYPFTSRGLHPYNRSFSIRGTQAVVMGWPKRGKAYTDELDKLRRSFNQFGIFHKYHDSKDASDNDFYFVLGDIPGVINPDLIVECEDSVREFLSQHGRVSVRLDWECFKIALYCEGDTSFQNVKPITLRNAKPHIDRLRRYYPELPQ